MDPTFPLVSASWLREHLGVTNLRLVDGTYHLPILARDAAQEFLTGHIPGARRFDIDAIADRTNPLPHMLPSAEFFETAVGALGIGNDDLVVAYDTVAGMGAARVWWMFRAFGHRRVAVLDGGLDAWRRAGGTISRGEPPEAAPVAFRATPHAALIRDADEVARAADEGNVQIVDARGAVRFRGEAAEPRAGVRSGHIPSSRSLPFGDLLEPDGRFKSAADIRNVLLTAGIDPERPVIASCGSGVTACMVALGLAVAGGSEAGVYDGSWAEWGADARRPIATGPA